MRENRFIVALLWLLLPQTLWGQSDSGVIMLKPADVFGALEVHVFYGEHYSWDSLGDLTRVAGGNSLADFLARESPVFFKRYGGGMLSSISLRGTGASHTAVMWNGVNINMPTLGQTDFSQVPVTLVDGLALQLGPGSADYGTAALGGSIHLESKLPWGEEGGARLRLGVGSFGEQQYGLRMGRGTKTWAWRIRVSHVAAENDFWYTDITDPQQPRVRQPHAAWSQTSIQPSFGWSPLPGHRLALHGWWQQTYREIQPVMGRERGVDVQEDSTSRWNIQYRYTGNRVHVESSIAHLRDAITYNGGPSWSNQMVEQVKTGIKWQPNWRSEVGMQAVQATAFGASYLADAQQNQVGIWANTIWRPHGQWEVGLRLRQTLWDGQWVPFTPSVHLKGPWALGSWQVRGARSYRIPTLNDQFWIRSVQQPMVPEEAWSGEGTLEWEFAEGVVSLTGYAMRVSNWILWVPGGTDWYPTNVREVHNLGLEMVVEKGRLMGPLRWQARGQYAYNRTKIVADAVSPSLGNQLPYTPRQQGSGWVRGTYGRLSGRLSAQVAGLRYVSTDNVSELPSYATADVQVGYQQPLGKHRLAAVAEVRNVFNADYQVVRLRAMPGRSFHLTLQFEYLFDKR